MVHRLTALVANSLSDSTSNCLTYDRRSVRLICVKGRKFVAILVGTAGVQILNADGVLDNLGFPTLPHSAVFPPAADFNFVYGSPR
jgi:hypothetical protein